LNDTAQLGESVTVAVPGRLHLGFLDLAGSLGRRFGSIGLAITGVRTRLTVGRAPQTEAVGPQADRVERHLETMRRELGLAGAYRVRIEEAAPAHAGFGSGTQIALALAAAVRRLAKLPLDVRGDAVRLGRGLRSGVGIGLFDCGGLVVDGGRTPDAAAAAPIVCRLPFPEHWRVLVIIDPARQGMHSEAEAAAFAKLPAFPDMLAGHFCRLVLMQALPAVVERDIARFGTAIRDLQMQLGDYYAPGQGGERFASPDVAAVLTELDRDGAFGIGQSSWGPTGFAFAPSAEEADRLAAIARRHPRGKGLDIRLCAGLNRGASITARVDGAAPNK
jgi:beta-ribofuranosylaminobenzene 5'-phosphate synthase